MYSETLTVNRKSHKKSLKCQKDWYRITKSFLMELKVPFWMDWQKRSSSSFTAAQQVYIINFKLVSNYCCSFVETLRYLFAMKWKLCGRKSSIFMKFPRNGITVKATMLSHFRTNSQYEITLRDDWNESL